jgi:predicted DNA-binding transcriptional regulator AlpA
MRPKQFTLVSVKTTPAAALLLRYADGEQFEVNLVDTIQRIPSLERLKDPEVFRAAQVGEHGASVIWANDDDLELAADNLRARAVEQAGGVSHEFIWRWMSRHNLTLDTAADALGLSRRMLAYYRSGAKPVPRTVALACLGWEDVIKNKGRFALAA